MRVLVTGASGGLTPFVICALWERHEVVLMSRRPPQAEFATLPWGQGDITVFADCQRAVQGIDAIQHLAAQPWPGWTIRACGDQPRPKACPLTPRFRALCSGRMTSYRLR